MTEHADFIISPSWVVPVVPKYQVLENHSVVVAGGKIAAILPRDEAVATYDVTEISKPGHVLIPGFVNAHTHAAMSLLKGLADDLPLMSWLQDHIWPVEGRWVSQQFVYDGAKFAGAEMLLGGTTCINDMYMFPESTARAARDLGMRATVGLIAIEFPTAYAENMDEYLSKGLALHDELRTDPLIETIFAPHAPYTVSPDSLKRIRVLSDELDIGIHMHIHETADEVATAVNESGKRPLESLHDLSIMTPTTVAVHMTQLDDDEIAALAARDSHVVHCPESNLKLASGYCRVADLLDAGVNVALGTDGSASNNDLDMFGEMRTAAMMAKGVAQNAAVVDAATALEMATINGAKAIMRAADIGSIEIGKMADLTLVDLDNVRNQPVYNPISQLVYTCNASDVSDVWVGGQQVVANGRLASADQDDILQIGKDWAQKIQAGRDEGLPA